MNVLHGTALAPFGQKLSHLGGVPSTDEVGLTSLPFTKDQYRPNVPIREAGIEEPQSLVVLQGLVASCRVRRNGERQIVALHLPGDLIGYSEVSVNRAPYTLAAATQAEIGSFATCDLRVLVSKSERLRKALLRAAAIDNAITREWLFNVGRRNALQRVAAFFCEYDLRASAAGLTFGVTLPICPTQEVMADCLSLTPVHVNRKFQELRSLGALPSRGDTRTEANRAALRGIAEFDASYLDLLATASLSTKLTPKPDDVPRAVQVAV